MGSLIFTVLYLVFLSFISIKLGMSIESTRAKRRWQDLNKQAFARGWDAGYNFLGHISKEKTEHESSVRVLTGDGEEVHAEWAARASKLNNSL